MMIPIASDTLTKAKTYAFKLIQIRPRSVKEMEERLRQKRFSDELITQVVEGLKASGQLDDDKFAVWFAQSRLYTKPTGKRLLEFEMKQKGLNRSLISQTLERLTDLDENRMVREIIHKKLSSLKAYPRVVQRRRLASYLQRRGFKPDVIFEEIDEALQHE